MRLTFSEQPEASLSERSGSSSGLELLARWLLIAGVFALLGGTVAALAGFGGRRGRELSLPCAGWFAAALGLLLLAEAQRRSSGASVGELFETDVGEALLWRGFALAAAAARARSRPAGSARAQRRARPRRPRLAGGDRRPRRRGPRRRRRALETRLDDVQDRSLSPPILAWR